MLRLHAPSLRLSQTLLRGPALRYPALTDLRAALINALYGNGEEGALYDPSDLSTMYQDVKGRVPVTGADQPVALLLDLSKERTLGSEIPLGSFSISDFGGSSGYTSSNPLTFGNSTVGTANAYPRFSSFFLTAGRVYRVSGRLSGDIDKVAGIFIGSPTAANSLNYDPLTGVFHSDAGYAGDNRFTLNMNGTSICEVVMEEISIRELSGNHAIAPSDAARPLAKANPWWVDYDGVDDLLRTVFPDLGTDCTVGRAVPGVGASILTGQTINGNFDDSTDHAGLVIVDRALTVGETDMLTQWLASKAGVTL